MKQAVLCILILFSLILQGCTTHKCGFPPNLGVDETDFVPGKDDSFVIIGFISDESLSQVGVSGEPDRVRITSWEKLEKNQLNTLAIHYKVGDTFQLTNVPYLSRNQNLVDFRFLNTPALALDQSGIYFYGFFQTKDHEGYFVPDYDQKIIARAKIQYPVVFKYLTPVNFKEER